MHKQPAPQLASPWARLRAALGRVVGLGDASARDRRLADEIAFHIDMATERNRRAGMSAADARRAALLEFGGIERSKEAARDEHRSRPIEDALRDLNYAMRSLRRAPAFALTTVLTLAIGIGANTAIFSAVDGVLLKPLPYADADRLMTLWQRDAAKATQDLLSPANFLDWRDRTRAFETIATAEPFSMTLTTSDGPEMIRNWNVSEAFFQTLAVRPFLGRFFTAADHLPNHAPVIVISYESWQRRFGARRDILGERLQLDGRAATIVGVIPRGAAYPAGRELWSPKVFTAEDREMRASAFLPTIGRLRAGVKPAAAEAELTGISAQLAKEYPRTNANIGAQVVPLGDHLVGGLRRTLWLLVGAVGLLLLVACANVANLLMARTKRRGRELAIRAALGAGQGRVVRQLMVENLLLAVVGAVGGVVLARWGAAAIRALSPAGLPRVDQIEVDIRAFAFALGAALITTIVFGLMPSRRAARTDPQEELKSGSRSATSGRDHRRARTMIVGGEVALAVVLLAGAGLLVRSFVAVLKVDRGYRGDHVTTATMFTWQWNPGPAKLTGFADELVTRVRALPGVRAAAVATSVPLAEPIGPSTGQFTIEGRASGATGDDQAAHVTVSTPELFNVLNIPSLRGRLFTRDDDAAHTPVLLINETMARRFWPNENPIGRRVSLRYAGKPIVREVIGVVGDVRQRSLELPAEAGIFLPLAQSPTGSIMLVVRTNPATDVAIVPAIRSTVKSMNADLPIARTGTIEQLTDDALRFRRFVLLLLGSFSATALALAIVGVYGLIAQSAVERTHELGIRLALGASRSGVLSFMMREALSPAATGVVVGLGASFALTRFLRGLLYSVAPTDMVTFGVVSLMMLGLAAAASFAPAWRATRVDPLTALRHG